MASAQIMYVEPLSACELCVRDGGQTYMDQYDMGPWHHFGTIEVMCARARVRLATKYQHNPDMLNYLLERSEKRMR